MPQHNKHRLVTRFIHSRASKAGFGSYAEVHKKLREMGHDITYAAVCAWYSGQNIPGPKGRKMLADVYGLSTEERIAFYELGTKSSKKGGKSPGFDSDEVETGDPILDSPTTDSGELR